MGSTPRLLPDTAGKSWSATPESDSNCFRSGRIGTCLSFSPCSGVPTTALGSGKQSNSSSRSLEERNLPTKPFAGRGCCARRPEDRHAETSCPRARPGGDQGPPVPALPTEVIGTAPGRQSSWQSPGTVPLGHSSEGLAGRSWGPSQDLASAQTRLTQVPRQPERKQDAVRKVGSGARRQAGQDERAPGTRCRQPFPLVRCLRDAPPDCLRLRLVVRRVSLIA
jgi:hypothetical protein